MSLDRNILRSSTILMLDLEGTVIDNWDRRNDLWENIRKIKTFISSRPDIVAFSVFSFAIATSDELHDFNKTLKPWLTRTFSDLEFKDTLTHSRETVAEIISDNRKTHIDSFDLHKLFGKDLSFVIWAQKFHNQDFILIDDMVGNFTMSLKEQHLEILNIKTLGDL